MTKDTEENPYQQALAESVHYSLKTVNSNIEKGGIRLAQSHALNLPYISARTLLADDFLVPTDYQVNAGKTATLFKVVKAAQLDEELSEADEEFKQNVALLKPHLNKIFEQPFTAGLDIIDIRMRQLLIPKNNEYLSISPLSAAGLNLLINTEVDALKEQRKAEGKNTKLKNIKTAVFGIGGSNPQNVGSLVRSMQRPLVLDSPTQDPETRLAFQYFYKGFDYQISNAYINRAMYQELTEYAKSLIEQQKLSLKVGFHEHGIHAPFSNMQTRAAELTTIQKVVDDVLQQGQDILQILKSVANDLPSLKVLERKSRWSHPRVSLIAQGLINPELQQFEDWQQFFADDLARRITKHSYWKKRLKIRLILAYRKLMPKASSHVVFRSF